MKYRSPDEFFKDNIVRYQEIAEMNIDLAINIAIEDVWDFLMKDINDDCYRCKYFRGLGVDCRIPTLTPCPV